MINDEIVNSIQEIIHNNTFSESERRGIEYLNDTDLTIYCPGISTGGVAEIKMVLNNPSRRVIATTIDSEGIDSVESTLKTMGLQDRIEVKHEDVSEPLPYDDETFDYIYARLVLHYLPRQKLHAALQELNRVIRPKGRLFVVVRSKDDPDTKIQGTTYDPETGLTTYPWMDEAGNIHPDKPVSRYFHSQESISEHLREAGFTINKLVQHDEQLYLDFGRQRLSSQIANVIDVLVQK